MSVLLKCSLLLTIIYMVHAQEAPRAAVATVKAQDLLSTNSFLIGTIVLTETPEGLRIAGSVAGLSQNEKYKLQVHQLGAITSCATTGDQLDPAGDLGNTAFAEANLGIVNINVLDTVLTLRGENSVLGRSLVLHSETADSAGQTRVACGVIGIMSPATSWNSAATSAPSVLLFIAATFVAYFRR